MRNVNEIRTAYPSVLFQEQGTNESFRAIQKTLVVNPFFGCLLIMSIRIQFDINSFELDGCNTGYVNLTHEWPNVIRM